MPCLRGGLDAVGEREERVGREHAALRLGARLLARDLHARSTRDICPAPTPTVRVALARGRSRSTSRACRRARRTRAPRAPRRVGARLVTTLPLVDLARRAVASRALHDEAAADALVLRARACSAASHAPVASRRRFFFARRISSAPRRERRRDDALEERLGEELRRRRVDLAVERDDAAERATARRPRARCGRRRRASRATATPHGFVCFTTTAAGRVELAHRLERRVDVDEVVERELLAAGAEALGARERARPARRARRRTRPSGAGSRRSGGRRRARTAA